MEFLIFWLGTGVGSFVMEMANELRMYKDVADAGYKIDTRRLSELGKQLNPNASKSIFLSMLIPIFNIIRVLQKTIQYNNLRPMLLDQLNVIDVIEEMSEFEKREYLKNPTGLNAVIIPLKSEIRLSKASSITINDKSEYSKIYYEMGNSLNDITILKVTGFASRLTEEEQKRKVIDTCKSLAEVGTKKYGDVETLVDAFKDNKSINLSDSKEEKTDEKITSTASPELGNSDKKQELEKLKSELLEGQEEVQSNQTDKKSVLLKRKK